eukprot:5312245-Lingulodinium_polyedra.AAC.1
MYIMCERVCKSGCPHSGAGIDGHTRDTRGPTRKLQTTAGVSPAQARGSALASWAPRVSMHPNA